MVLHADQTADELRLVPRRLAVPITADDHVLGPATVDATLLVYGEFECPHCGRAHVQLKALREHLTDLNARFVFRHFARDDVHPFSVRAAVAAEAAGLQGRFWEMHDLLFEHQHSLEFEDLERHAVSAGLDVERFLADMLNEDLKRKVDAQGQSAIASGVSVTPTFFINGERYDGSYEVDDLIAALRRTV